MTPVRETMTRLHAFKKPKPPNLHPSALVGLGLAFVRAARPQGLLLLLLLLLARQLRVQGLGFRVEG